MRPAGATVVAVGGGRRCADPQQRRAGVDLRVRCDEDLLDHAVGGRGDGGLHLHRLDHRDPLTGHDRLARQRRRRDTTSDTAGARTRPPSSREKPVRDPVDLDEVLGAERLGHEAVAAGRRR